MLSRTVNSTVTSSTASVAPDVSSSPAGASSSSLTPVVPQEQQLDKSEINDAVTKVLQGYDWTLVPIASK